MNLDGLFPPIDDAESFAHYQDLFRGPTGPPLSTGASAWSDENVLSPTLSEAGDMASLDESVLRMMRDEWGTAPSHDRFYYSQVYDRLLHHAPAEVSDDFAQYNQKVVKEMALRAHFAAWRQEKADALAENNVLKIVDLDESFQPTYFNRTKYSASGAVKTLKRGSEVGLERGSEKKCEKKSDLKRSETNSHLKKESEFKVSEPKGPDPFTFFKRLRNTGRPKESSPEPSMGTKRTANVYELSTISSRDTKVIDETVVGQIPIDLQANPEAASSSAFPEAYFGQSDCFRKDMYEKSRNDGSYNPPTPLRFIPHDSAPPNVLQHKLRPRHLQMIAFGGTLGVGLLLAIGKSFTIAGPLGAIIGFMFSGVIVLCTMLSYCEMITLIPLAGGLSGISSRFVDDAFGFSLSFNYWLSYTIGLPTEIVAATIMLSYYRNSHVPESVGITLASIFTFMVLTVGINLFDVRVYGEIEYYSSIVKAGMLIAWIIFMICLNQGHAGGDGEKIGFRFWDASKSNEAIGLTFGPFRPTFDVNDHGSGSLNGITGSLGRFLAVIVAAVVAGYAYSGTDIVLIAAGEARAPRTALPKASKNIFWRIGIFYILGVFVVGLNFYSGDPRLLRYYSKAGVNKETQSVSSIILYVLSSIQNNAHNFTVTTDSQREVADYYARSLSNCDPTFIKWAGFSNGNQSPWIIAIQGAGLCLFSSVFNGLMMFFALSSGSSQLYASSRTLYYMAIQGKAPAIFLRCSSRGVPYVAVLFLGMFAGLAVLSCTSNTAVVFQRFLSVCATAGLLVWSGMCLSFIRFYHGLKYRPDIISRDDPAYPYRSPFQPYLAYIGCLGGLFLVFSSGFVVFLNGNWDTSFFFSCYGSLILFVLGFLGYKFIRGTKIHRLDQLDLDSGRRGIDKIIWEEDRFKSNASFKQTAFKIFELVL
ncbi:hypothetical protein BABINDRAFT_158973 [Babjeviella inositovora NRRL Y-12698]|uniref:Amino acid permease/ SLC12A domain-containing protein n=1 Tax=Babjeviella inositovora NRRL Y-12698 TaxID=984486 RepID=A0A1E3QXG1_9ASCO|nr:uncharacterized protein BABINDRAFT_158973 [Babjeviella inositovora NRRL Y-12698]ODQ82360.1 hypothetical protein BABINDRAFT_158973 [Babjeviella inositovora NRRL Y-12698]